MDSDLEDDEIITETERESRAMTITESAQDV